MEINISVSELSKALNIVQGVVQRKNTMPILSHVLLETTVNSSGEGCLVLSATDLDVGMRIMRTCEVKEPGAITVSARALLDIVKMLPKPQVTLKGLPNQHLHIQSGKTNARLLALAPEEFPKLTDTSGTQFHSIKTALFADMIQKTIYATSQDENRYNLTGVYFEPQSDSPQQVVLVATDGHRLSRVQHVLTSDSTRFEQSAILPRKGLTEMLRLLETVQDKENSTFEFGLLGNQAIIKTQDTVLTMRLIEGKFPDYHQVIPKVSDKIIQLSRLDLLTSLKRVSVLASDKTQSVKLVTNKDELTVSCVNPEAGEVSDNLPIEYKGPEVEIGFNARYIIEALASLTENDVIIKLTDSLSPVLIAGMGESRHLCVVMPMRM